MSSNTESDLPLSIINFNISRNFLHDAIAALLSAVLLNCLHSACYSDIRFLQVSTKVLDGCQYHFTGVHDQCDDFAVLPQRFRLPMPGRRTIRDTLNYVSFCLTSQYQDLCYDVVYVERFAFLQYNATYCFLRLLFSIGSFHSVTVPFEVRYPIRKKKSSSILPHRPATHSSFAALFFCHHVLIDTAVFHLCNLAQLLRFLEMPYCVT